MLRVLSRSSCGVSPSSGACAACVVGLLLAVAAVQGQGQEDAQPRTDSGWVVVQEWSGGYETLKTDVFTPSSRPWRVSYKATSGERWGLLDIFVRTKDGEHVGSALNMQLFAFGEDARSGSFLVHSDHDGYVLEIISNNLEWHVAVEQRR